MNAALLALWIVLALLAYRALPEQIPIHFAAYGAPTRFEPTTLWRWLFLPGTALALLLALPLLERATLAINRPYGIGPREPEARRTWKRLRRSYLDLLGTATIVALALLHLGVWTVATGRAERIPLPLIALPFVAFFLACLFIVPFHRATRALAKDAAPDPEGEAASA